jgi:hypothetical protein
MTEEDKRRRLLTPTRATSRPQAADVTMPMPNTKDVISMENSPTFCDSSLPDKYNSFTYEFSFLLSSYILNLLRYIWEMDKYPHRADRDINVADITNGITTGLKIRESVKN